MNDIAIPVTTIGALLLFGLLIGPTGIDVVPDVAEPRFLLVTDIAMTLGGFTLGRRLTTAGFRRHGRAELANSVAVSAVTAAVGAGVLPLAVALPSRGGTRFRRGARHV